MSIKQFQGEYRWLSNFAKLETPIEQNGIYYPTVEHFYVAMKTLDDTHRRVIANLDTAGQAKRYGRTLSLHRGWDNIKLKVMYVAIQHKFSDLNPKYRDLLLATGKESIVEGNYWNDMFWGVSLKSKIGLNKLGKLIMQRRKELNDAAI